MPGMRSLATLCTTPAGQCYALSLTWHAIWLVLFGLLPPHEKASAVPGALEVSGNSITYDGSPVRLRGVATEDVYDL